MLFVNVYEVDRRFGGYEEGSWYFNHYDCIEVYPVREGNEDAIVKHLENEYGDREYGNISSVHGGLEIHVLVESKPAESETIERPIYE